MAQQIHSTRINNHKRKKPDNYCLDCGIQITRQGKRCHRCAVIEASKYKNITGKNNPNWKEDKIYIDYPLEWTEKLKAQIRKKDNHTCQECGILESDCNVKLHVHHIDFNKINCHSDNLISLCHSCHAKTVVASMEKKMFWINRYSKVKVA